MMSKSELSIHPPFYMYSGGELKVVRDILEYGQLTANGWRQISEEHYLNLIDRNNTPPTFYQIIDNFINEHGDVKMTKETRDTFYRAAYRMEKAGWTAETMMELLGDIYRAMMDEFVG